MKPEIQALLAPEQTKGYPNPHRVPEFAPAPAAAPAFPFIPNNNEQEPEMYDDEYEVELTHTPPSHTCERRTRIGSSR